MEKDNKTIPKIKLYENISSLIQTFPSIEKYYKDNYKLDKLNDSIPVFSFIGRLTQQKGVLLILEVAEKIILNYNIQLLIGGMGNLKDPYCLKCINDNQNVVLNPITEVGIKKLDEEESTDEQNNMIMSKWKKDIENDRFYNKNLRRDILNISVKSNKGE